MSRVISMADAQAKGAQYQDAPPLGLLPEDSSEVMEAIAELSASIEKLCKLVESLPGDGHGLREVLGAIATGNKTLADKLKTPPVAKQWKFKVNRDAYGFIDTVDAFRAGG